MDKHLRSIWRRDPVKGRRFERNAQLPAGRAPLARPGLLDCTRLVHLVPPGQRWNHPGSLIAIRDRRADGEERRGHSPRLAADQSPCPRTRRRPASRPPRRRPRRARPRHGPSFRRYASHGIAVEGAARRAGASDSGLGLPARHGQNDCEIVLSRKNFLFAGADSGGKRAAAMYTLLETAKLNGLNPEAYLRHVLERIADHPINRIDELLPRNVVELQRPLAEAA